MNQAVHAGQNLSEGTEGHQLDDLGIHNVAHGILGHELIPGVHLGGLVAQRNLVLLGVEGNDVNVDLVADLNDVLNLSVGVVCQLVEGYVTRVLCTQLYNSLVRLNAYNCCLNFGAVI